MVEKRVLIVWACRLRERSTIQVNWRHQRLCICRVRHHRSSAEGLQSKRCHRRKVEALANSFFNNSFLVPGRGRRGVGKPSKHER